MALDPALKTALAEQTQELRREFDDRLDRFEDTFISWRAGVDKQVSEAVTEAKAATSMRADLLEMKVDVKTLLTAKSLKDGIEIGRTQTLSEVRQNSEWGWKKVGGLLALMSAAAGVVSWAMQHLVH